jgi:PRC-barrel domain
MSKSMPVRSILLGTALTLPFAASGLAQVQINEEQLAGKSAECRQLAELIQNRDEPVTAVPSDDIIGAINADSAEECSALHAQIAPADGSDLTETEQASETEQVSEEVDLSEEATIEGQAVVSVPEPDVDVQVPPPNVRVTEQHPQIDITQEPLQIDVQQARPRIAVEIPQIVVRVEIPAPQLYVLRQDPQVQVSEADPQVEVVQGEPAVSVRQADPELNVELGVDVEEQAGEATGTETAGASQETSGEEQQVEGDVSVAEDEPQVEIVQAEGEPQMSYESGEPSLAYQDVEPEVLVMMAEQPTIEVQQSGEASVVLETAEEREQRRQQQQAESEGTGEQAQPEQQLAQTQQTEPQDAATEAEAGGSATMTVAELMGMTVVTADGEDLGSPAAFVDINGEPNLVLESGGFLGIGGKEVPVRMSRVSVQDEQLLIETLTAEEIEAANDFEYDDNLRLPEDEQIEVGG